MEEAMTATRIGCRARARVSAAAALTLATMLVLPMRPVSAAQDPNAFINQLGTAGVATFQPGIAPQERLARLGELFRQDFDVRGIGTFALGRYRWVATPHEKREYFKLFSNFTVRAVNNKLGEYGAAGFQITGEQRGEDGQVVVSSELSRAGGNPVPVQWVLLHKHGRFMVSDLRVADTSMRLALRDQFASWIEGNGGRFDALLAVLRQMIAQWH
jgi:phospholipid transport system substrate-binding protein